MSTSTGRVLVVAIASLVWLTGCETSTKLTGLFGQRDESGATASIDNPAAAAEPAITDPAATGSTGLPGGVAAAGGAVVVEPDPVLNAASPKLLGKDPHDDLNLGKKYFSNANFGLAEKHFRRAVERHPRDADAWVGLAASYDRLKRFELADRAYSQAARIVGDTPELMNNRGFSYILRGDYRRARRTLETAQKRAPDNPYIRNNLELLEKAQRRAKSVN